MYKEAVESCNKVVAIDPDNSKAHFRKAKVGESAIFWCALVCDFVVL